LSEARSADDALDLLARRAQAGEPEAFRDLLRRCYDRIYRWALVRSGDPDDADEVTQEVLVRLHERLDRYAGRSRFTTWLYQVTHNSARGFVRSRSRRARAHQRAAREMEERARDQAVPQPVGEIESLVRALLEELPLRQRTVFDLVDLQDHSAAEVSEMLNLEPATVRVHLLRARRALRQRILERHADLVEARR
jgi:RNA polymerase sigma-70 factor (ECF subfamily)